MVVVNIDYDDLLQGVIDVSGEPGPGVDTDHPVDPDDPGSELSNTASVWDKE